MVDASAVRVARFELFSADGRPIRGLVLVSDGVRLKTPDGRTLAINDPWVLLNHFDSDGDARLAPNDWVKRDRRDERYLYGQERRAWAHGCGHSSKSLTRPRGYAGTDQAAPKAALHGQDP